MKKIIYIFLTLVLITGCGEKKEEKKEEIDVNQYYNEFVKTNKEAKLYNSNLEEVGKIGKDIELSLDGTNKEYFKIKSLDSEYYINYQDVDKITTLSTKDERYKKYIPFNKNIVTKSITKFYDNNNNLKFEIKKSFNLPILIDDSDNNKYYVVYNDELLYVNEYESIIDSNNTTEKNAEGIPVMNYHFIYAEGESCNEEICMSEKQFREQLDYIVQNGFFTPTMNELELYIDKKIQLPKSVVLTADDGAFAKNYIRVLNEYKLNGTYFIVTSWYDPSELKSEYVELHSHSHDMHNQGVCPGGQGGPIKCLDHDKLQQDLKKSREMLDNTTVFCYPFYEFNNYSIDNLKEAGFTMAFAGERSGGDIVARPGGKKYQIPRWVMVNYTTMKDFKTYLDLGIA